MSGCWWLRPHIVKQSVLQSIHFLIVRITIIWRLNVSWETPSLSGSKGHRSVGKRCGLVSGGLWVTTSSHVRRLAPGTSWGNMVSIGSMMRTGALMNHFEDVLMYSFSFLCNQFRQIWAGKVYRSWCGCWLVRARARATCCEKSEVGAENGAFISPVPAASPGRQTCKRCLERRRCLCLQV